MLLTILRALGAFAISFLMGMVGIVLGIVIYFGFSDQLLAMEEQYALVARVLAFICIGGSGIVGGIYGLHRGARWTGLYRRNGF